MSEQRRLDSWLIVGLAFVSLGGPLLVLARYDLASQFEDDAFYYFQIAKNVAHGRGFTFDGIHATNGFHPLWLALLVPIFGLISDLDAAVRAAALLESILVAAAALLIYRALRPRTGPSAAALAAIALFAFPGTRSVLRVGLESALSVFLLVAVWCAWLGLERERISSWLRLGGLCALACLARLETISALLAIAILEHRNLVHSPRKIAALVSPTAVAIGTYALWSFSVFSVWLPVSGMVKSHWARRDGHSIGLPLGVTIPDGAPRTLSVVAAVSIAAWLVAKARPAWASPWRGIGLEFLILTTLGIIAVDALSVGGMARWYLGPIVLTGAIASAARVRSHEHLARAAVAGLVVLSVLRAPYTVWAVHNHVLSAHVFGSAADWLRANTAPDARVGSWNGGILGYYSDRHVVMIDGLANDATFYHRVVVGRDLTGYLDDERIDFLSAGGCHRRLPSLAVGAAVAQPIEQSWRVLKTTVTRTVADGGCRDVTFWVRGHAH